MDADAYIARVWASNPSLVAAAKLQITPQSLERQLRKAHLAGYKEGYGDAAKDAVEVNSARDDAAEDLGIPSIFDKIFGGKK